MIGHWALKLPNFQTKNMVNHESFAITVRTCNIINYPKSSRALTTFYNSQSSNHINSIIINNQENNPKKHVLTLLGELQYYGSPQILAKIISFCSKSHLFDVGIQFHSTIIKLGFTSNVYVNSGLVNLYAKCGCFDSAYKMFDEMTERNVVTWNSLISGYLQAEIPDTALGLFLGLMREGIRVTEFVASSALVGWAQLDSSELGVELHGLCMKNGFSLNVVVGTGLINMYAKCWCLEEARRVFDWMLEKNAVTWTTMIAGYSQYRLSFEAMVLFKEMQRLGLKSSNVTCNNLVSSFSGREHLDHCKQVHSHIIPEVFLSETYIRICLVTAYAECNCSLEDFKRVCLYIEKWDLVSWNALIDGFAHLECNEKALECFSTMRRTGIDCDFITLTSVLRALGTISCLELGKQVHALALKIGSAFSLRVQNALVSMYGRCGCISDTKRVFFSMKEPDLISWNSLLAGFCYHGYGREVIELFEEMRRTSTQPDQNTFISVLSACSHSGMVNEGLNYYKLLAALHPSEPFSMELYATVVDLLGRAGYVDEAITFIRGMPVVPGPSIYKTLLSACKLHGNMKAGVWASHKLLEQNPHDTAAVIMLYNSLATQGRWDEAEGIRKLMQQRSTDRKPGCSWVESSE